MLGTIVNATAIIIGGFSGVVLKKVINEKYNETIIKSIALSVLIIGVMKAMETQNVLLMIISMAIGTLIGEMMGIEDKLEKFGDSLQSRYSKGDSTFATGFVTATLIYCVGSMGVLGAMESGLTGNHETLFAKSTLDGISAIIFSSTFGVGVLFSAIPVFLYQGFITLASGFMKAFLVDAAILEMSAVGGLLIVAIGLNVLEVKKIKVGNMIPAIFIPLIYYTIVGFVG